MSTPPEVGKGLSVRVDDSLYDDLAVLLKAGGKLSDAVRDAVRHAADAYRAAWDYGDYPEGIAPALRVKYDPYDTASVPLDGRITATGQDE